MQVAKRGLGKGLEFMLGDNNQIYTENISNKDVTTLRLAVIEPNINQPRKSFDEEKLSVLAESIKEHGLIQPIIVTPSENGMYRIVAGERRWRACKRAGLKEIPVVIRDYSDEQAAEVALIENLQREDLNPIEEARGFYSLLEDFSMTQELVSRRVGKSRSAIANSLRLLSLDGQIQKLLINGDISSGHARAILSLDNDEARLALAKRIISDGLNVRQAEALSKQIQKKAPPKKKKAPSALDIETERIQDELSARLGTRVRITHTAKKGKIEIEYYGNDDLERLLAILNTEE